MENTIRKVRCFRCGRERMFGGEGRFIDGSWLEDKPLIERGIHDVWVCGWNCYRHLAFTKQQVNN
jgi:hypothetical protein